MAEHDFSCGKCGACACNGMTDLPENAIPFLVGLASMIVHDPFCVIDSLCPFHRRTLSAIVEQLEDSARLNSIRRQAVN